MFLLSIVYLEVVFDVPANIVYLEVVSDVPAQYCISGGNI